MIDEDLPIKDRKETLSLSVPEVSPTKS